MKLNRTSLNRIARHPILVAYFTSLLGILSGLLTNLWLLRQLTRVASSHDFGVYALALQISSYLSIAQLGMDFAASRRIAEALGRSDAAAANRAYWDLRRFNSKGSIIVLAASIGIAVLVGAGIGGISGPSAQLASEIIAVSGLSQSLCFASRPFAAALTGSQRQAEVNLLAVSRTLGTTLCAWGLLVNGFYLLSVPCAEVLTYLGIIWLLSNRVRSNCGWLAVKIRGDKKSFKQTLAFAGLTSLGGLGWTLEAGSDVIILGLLTGPETVSGYVLWWRFPQMIFDLSSRLAFSAFPSFANRYSRSRAASGELLARVATVTLGLATLAYIGISHLLPTFVQVWIGKYAAAQSQWLAFAMGSLVCARACGNLAGMFWLSTGRAGLTTSLCWMQAALKIALSFALVPSLGVLGVVCASFAAAVVQVVGVTVFLRTEQLIPKGFLPRAAILLTGAVVVSSFAKGAAYPIGWFALLGLATSFCILWGGVWTLFAVTGNLRAPLRLLLGKSHRK